MKKPQTNKGEHKAEPRFGAELDSIARLGESACREHLERTMDALFEEWWAKDRTPWMHANKEGAKFLFTISFLAGREYKLQQQADSPNDPKLSDGGGWRGPCMAGGKAAAEARAVTAVAVRCSAWLGHSPCDINWVPFVEAEAA